MVNKKVVIICSIIAIIIVAIIVAFQIKKLNETTGDVDIVEENTNEENVVEEEFLEEEIIQNEADTQNTVSVEENEADSETQNQYTGEEESSLNDEEDEESGEETALALVKEEWGEDDSVYYTVDNQSNNVYNIAVRSKSTTVALAEYEVDINSGTVTLK